MIYTRAHFTQSKTFRLLPKLWNSPPWITIRLLFLVLFKGARPSQPESVHGRLNEHSSCGEDSGVQRLNFGVWSLEYEPHSLKLIVWSSQSAPRSLNLRIDSHWTSESPQWPNFRVRTSVSESLPVSLSLSLSLLGRDSTQTASHIKMRNLCDTMCGLTWDREKKTIWEA